MTKWLSITLLLLLTGSLPLSAKPANPIEGTWGGKWDDRWPVFLVIHAGDHTDEYTIEYRWLENFDDPDFSRQTMHGDVVGKHIEAKFLRFKLTGDKGILFGGFQNPRMANLVRITPEPLDLKAVDLEKHGWKPEAIPAADALKKILADGAK